MEVGREGHERTHREARRRLQPPIPSAFGMRCGGLGGRMGVLGRERDGGVWERRRRFEAE